MATNKINWILILQAWAMAWVVVGHAPLTDITLPQPWYADITYHFAYSFHMPLFIFVSGYLFHLTRLKREMPWGKMIVDKLKRLGIPFLIFTLLALIVKSVFSKDMARPTTFGLTEYLYAVVYPSKGPLNEMWFIAVLFWMFALQPFWRWTLQTPAKEISTLIVLGALTFLTRHIEFIDVFELYRTTKYAVFFYMGILASKHIQMHNVGTGRYLYLILGIAIFAFLWMWPYEMWLPKALGGIAISIILALLLNKISPKIFFTFRDYTYQIFLMGIFVQMLIKILYQHHVIGSYAIAFFTSVICGLYVPVLISIAIKKTGNKWLKLAVGLK